MNQSQGVRSLREDERSLLHEILEKTGINPVILALRNIGAQVYCVGGAVRDLLLGQVAQDVDIEVHAIDEEILISVLSQFGSVGLQGKSFGVFRIASFDIDWSLPRSDGPGRRPVVTLDPYMGIVTALLRRDVTMNALAIDLFSMTLIDPYGGERDLSEGSLRAVSADTFIEDPLRFYRVMQFVARFAMTPDSQLNELCSNIDLTGVARERVEKEFEKMFLLASTPSAGIRWIAKIGRLNELYPELGMLIGIPQNPKWHPEGDVFEHTMQVLDAVALDASGSDQERIVLSYAALCHDMGKALTTKQHRNDGRLISYGHESAGIPLAQSFLGRITRTTLYSKQVLRLVEYHMRPCAFVEGSAGAFAYRRLAYYMQPMSLRFLARFARADKRGRNGLQQSPLLESVLCVDIFEDRAFQYGVLDGPIKPIVSGNDLLVAGVDPRQIGVLLQRAYWYQLSCEHCSRLDILRAIGVKG